MPKRWKPLARCFLFVLMLACLSSSATSQQKWRQLPATPDLPRPDHSGVVPVNGFHIWYAIFGQGSPVILLHGGPANSNYWGHQIPVLARHYQVITIDSRGQGR